MRVLSILLAATIFAAPAIAEKPTPELKITYEADTYRFGEIYRSERGTSVEDCAMMCNRDRGCVAWSLTPATFQIGPRCELKSAPGQASHRPGAASGMAEFWQMDPARHGNMRYQAPVFGEPLPAPAPELMGAPEPKVAIVKRPVAIASAPAPAFAPAPAVAPTQVTVAPAPAPIQVAEPPKRLIPPPIRNEAPKVVPVKVAAPTKEIAIAREAQQSDVPIYVNQPAPVEPHPLYGTPALPAKPSNSKLVFRDPSLTNAPTSDVQPADYNAALKRESQTPTPVPASANPAALLRTPWTDRDGTTPDYSVSGSDYVPGDEDATAGYVDGVPEAGS